MLLQTFILTEIEFSPGILMGFCPYMEPHALF